MNKEDEKYRIKPRRKYARQVWFMHGKATIMDPIEIKDAKNEKKVKEAYEHGTLGDIGKGRGF